MPNATPEQQAAYEKFVKNGMRVIYNKKSVPQMLKVLDGNGDPVSGLANAVTAIALRLTGSAKKAGVALSPEVVLHGSGELLEQLADFSAQSGGHKYADEELRQIAQQMVNGMKQPGPPASPPAAPAQAPAGPELMPRTP